jgi:hypothetical protein
LPTNRKELLEAVPGWQWDIHRDRWDFGFRLLNEFAEREGHCQVPTNNRTDDGFRLGEWVATQRAAKDGLSDVRKEQLQTLSGWVWNALDEKWETGFRHLTEFANREGHCRFPANYRTNDGYRLGTWVTNQRSTKSDLTAERKVRLEAVAGWSWDAHADQWEIGFLHLAAFAGREGHCKVPINHRTEDGYRLGIWVSTQRRMMDEIPDERKVRLEALPGWVWDVLGENWEEGFCYLKAFSDVEGHCNISNRYKTDDGYRLGQWVSVQRKNSNNVPDERKAKLEALPGWIWDVRAEQWEAGFRHLTGFASREGHCQLPKNYRTIDGYQLSSWVVTQRAAKDSLLDDRKQRLEATPGWSWDPHKDKWEKGFNELLQYQSEYGDVNVPKEWPSGLGSWANTQRQAKKNGKLVAERLTRLDEIGFVWLPRNKSES